MNMGTGLGGKQIRRAIEGARQPAPWAKWLEKVAVILGDKSKPNQEASTPRSGAERE